MHVFVCVIAGLDERYKELTYTEQLPYEIELLKRELLKKGAEVTGLKKCNTQKKGGGDDA